MVATIFLNGSQLIFLWFMTDVLFLWNNSQTWKNQQPIKGKFDLNLMQKKNKKLE